MTNGKNNHLRRWTWHDKAPSEGKIMNCCYMMPEQKLFFSPISTSFL